MHNNSRLYKSSVRILNALLILSLSLVDLGFSGQGLGFSPSSPASASPYTVHPTPALLRQVNAGQEASPIQSQLAAGLESNEPTDPAGWTALGQRYLDEGNWIYAIYAFRKLITLSPEDVDARIYLSAAVSGL